jgi:hypothetical protein
VEPVALKFASFDEADAADRAYYRQLRPEERLAIMLDLIFPETNGPEGSNAASERLERVYRITQLGAED